MGAPRERETKFRVQSLDRGGVYKTPELTIINAWNSVRTLEGSVRNKEGLLAYSRLSKEKNQYYVVEALY